MAHDVFISHSAKDKITGDAVCAMLESEGIRCWIAPRDVLPSMEWGEAIIDAIEECRIMVLVFTANANASPQIRREVERAVNRGVAILPMRIEDVLPGKGLEYFIGNVHWLDALTPPLEAHLRSLADTLKMLLARMDVRNPPPIPHAAADAPRPASGPEPSVARPFGPAFAPPLEPAAPARSAEGTPAKRGGRGGESAPRRFWSARSWTWAAGTVSALLLCAVFVGVHFGSRSAIANLPTAAPMPGGTPGPASATGPAGPTASPLPAPVATPGAPKTAKPAAVTGGVPPTPGAAADNATPLQETMRTLEDELSSIGSFSYRESILNKTANRIYQYAYVEQLSNIVADPAQCRLSFHRRVWFNGATRPTDSDDVLPLREVTNILTEPMSKYMSEVADQTRFVVTSTDPPMTVLAVHTPKGGSREAHFTDAALADRAAATLTQAVNLCGGHLAN